MILLNPKEFSNDYLDDNSKQLMGKTIDFFENKGKEKVKEDDRQRVWYKDFIDFQKKEKCFSTLLTPPEYGEENCRWDTFRNCQFNEILSFYGLAYWYTWQVSILGLGPVWMSKNQAMKEQAARLLKDGNVFAFGLSERDHGADIYSTEMALTPQDDDNFIANGSKYYIGNGNEAPMVSTFGKMSDSGDYVFFVANYMNEHYDLVKNICNSQNYVSEFCLDNYPGSICRR